MAPQTRMISSSDMAACPRRSMLAAHYVDHDTGCACQDEVALVRAIADADAKVRDAQREANALRAQGRRWFGDRWGVTS